MSAPAKPKFDTKMLALPAMFLFNKYVDMKDPKNIEYAQYGLGAVCILILTLHYFVYMSIEKKKDNRKIWVPPKPKPSLPFGLGPAEEPLKIEDFEETSYSAYETKLIKESAQQVLLNVGMSLFMSYQFKIHVSILMQCLMLPLTAIDTLILKKYLFSGSSNSQSYFGELHSPPTAAVIAAIMAERAGAEPAAATSEEASEEEKKTEESSDKQYGRFKKGEARVTEISEEQTAANSENKKKATSAASSSSSSSSSGKSSNSSKISTPASELD